MFPHTPGLYAEEYVRGDDYDALAAQLAKADVLIRHMRDCLDPRRTPGSLYGRADDYLKRRSVSADAARKDV